MAATHYSNSPTELQASFESGKSSNTYLSRRKGWSAKASAAIGAVSTRLDVQTPAMATTDFHYFPRVD